VTAGSPPRLGILLPLFGSSFAELREGARRAEAAGLDDVWVSDHLQSVPDAAAPVLEGWTTLVALAEATERIGLGSLVLSATFREPRVLARSVETLVDAAGPRLVLGLGAGWLASEHEAFELPFPPHAERLARLERTLDAVRERTPEVPLLVGGASGRALDLAVRKADLWNAPGDRLDELPGLVERLRARAVEEAGPPPAVVSRVGLILEATVEEAGARLARRTSDWTRIGLGPLGLVGDADEVVRRIGVHRALGVERIVVGLSRRDLAGGVLERLGEDVLPRVRGA
jgi:alkanesulfonate monooxygenase SsuD/methylene tetrahydromethanopterin reductase-like flavin-dependent oxidoreductase (luciferase family)